MITECSWKRGHLNSDKKYYDVARISKVISSRSRKGIMPQRNREENVACWIGPPPQLENNDKKV